jgi:hypothetical protein
MKRKKPCKPLLSKMSQGECLNALETGEVLSLDFMKKSLIEKHKEIEILKKENIELKNSKGSIENSQQEMSGSHNSNNFNTNIHIHVNSYDKTDYSILKDKIHTCIKNGKVDEAKLIKLLHFNKDHPENHNIRVANKRENRIQLYNGDKFEESNYKGKEGIWKLGQDTLMKTEEKQILDDESYFEDTDSNVTLEEKRERTKKLETIVHNGNEISIKTHKNLKRKKS